MQCQGCGTALAPYEHEYCGLCKAFQPVFKQEMTPTGQVKRKRGRPKKEKR